MRRSGSIPLAKLFALWIGLAAPLGILYPCRAEPAGREIAFDQTAFERAQKDGKPILVHITTDWCSVCHTQNAILADLFTEARFKPMVVFNVDFDRQKDLVRKFRATAQSTMIVYKGGLEETRMSGDTRPKAIALLLSKAL